MPRKKADLDVAAGIGLAVAFETENGLRCRVPKAWAGQMQFIHFEAAFQQV
jgi:hypothetical protein